MTAAVYVATFIRYTFVILAMVRLMWLAPRGWDNFYGWARSPAHGPAGATTLLDTVSRLRLRLVPDVRVFMLCSVCFSRGNFHHSLMASTHSHHSPPPVRVSGHDTRHARQVRSPMSPSSSHVPFSPGLRHILARRSHHVLRIAVVGT